MRVRYIIMLILILRIYFLLISAYDLIAILDISLFKVLKPYHYFMYLQAGVK